MNCRQVTRRVILAHLALLHVSIAVVAENAGFTNAMIPIEPGNRIYFSSADGNYSEFQKLIAHLTADTADCGMNIPLQYSTLWVKTSGNVFTDIPAMV